MAEKQAQWPEVAQAFKEKRRELVLSGSEISERIDSDGLDETIYRMSRLNFLEICKTTLEVLNEKLGNMENLTNLVLHSNHLSSIPSTIGNLSNLKILDLSNNKLEDLPIEFGELKELHTVNVSGNQLSSLPCVENLTNLHVVDFSSNQFEEFPEGLCHSNLKLLNTIQGSFNAITTVPPVISNLLSLKNLDLSNNKLLDVAPELGECSKVKELNLKENCFKDRRFGKLVQQCQPKSVLDYLAKMLAEQQKRSGKTSKKDRKKKQQRDLAPEPPKDVIVVTHFKEDGGVVVQVVDDLVKDVRPYIVCCVVRNVAFNPSSFKAFIAAQTKLHDGPLCDKRQKATIATHDLNAICAMMTNGRTPLLYTAKKPEELKLIPLGRHSETTADTLVATLRKEADDYRKEKKRHNFSGVHKYLDLLKDKPLYPCLVVETEVISFPPITNCQSSKISKESTDIFIEVTSSISLEMCKKVLDELLAIMLVKGHGVSVGGGEGGDDVAEGGDEPGDGEVGQGQRSLTVEQVKVLDEDGQLKVVYPSRVDLQSKAYTVERES